MALTIAIRYAAIRKQFGPGNGQDEIPILEYQLHVFNYINKILKIERKFNIILKYI